MAASTFFRTFAAGELSPALTSRADLAVYGQGLRRCRNFVVGRHGGAINRAGTAFMHACKTDSEDVRLVRYVSEVPGESMLIEMGVEYFRFYLNGVLVVIPSAGGDPDSYDNSIEYVPGEIATSAGIWYLCIATTTGNAPPSATYWHVMDQLDANGDYIYEIPTPFTAPREVNWAQSGRTISFVHQSSRPRDLLFLASDWWRFDEVTTVAQAGVPQNVAATQDPVLESITYEVRAVDFGAGAGPLSIAFTDDFSPATATAPIILTWDDPITGHPDQFEIYKNGFLLGQTTDNTLTDTGQPVTDPWSPGTGGGTVDEPLALDADQPSVVLTTRAWKYVATAVVAGEESFASDVATPTLEDPTITGKPHNLTCDPVDGATEYHWFADPNNTGIFGFVGVSAAEAFSYDGHGPDFGHQPPSDGGFFANSDFPACVGFYQQRRFYGNKPTAPDGVQGSRVGLPTNFTVSTPVVDSDGISFRLLGREQHAVRQILGVHDLIVLTDGGEWRTRTAPGEPLTPFNLPFDQDLYVGCKKDVRPTVIGNTVVYVQARGRKVVEVKFSQQVESLAARDLTLLASHLFDTFQMVALDYQYEAHSILWVCRDDGALLGATYIDGADVVGWHHHDTDGGNFEDVCVVPELDEDTVYVIVKRVIEGSDVRYIERLANRENAGVFLDASIEVDDPGLTVEGLDHLEGKLVTVAANNYAIGTRTVVDGAITRPAGDYATICIGLPITAELETLDLDAPGSDVRDRKKRIQSAGVLLDQSGKNFRLGPSAAKLRPIPNAPAVGLFSEYVEAMLESSHEFPGRVFIQHSEPTPLTILGILPRVELGG